MLEFIDRRRIPTAQAEVDTSERKFRSEFVPNWSPIVFLHPTQAASKSICTDLRDTDMIEAWSWRAYTFDALSIMPLSYRSQLRPTYKLFYTRPPKSIQGAICTDKSARVLLTP